MSYNKKQASFLQSGNISMLWYARDGYDWHAHAKEVSPFRGKSPRSIPKSNNTSGESRPVPLNRDSIESEKMNYAEDWRISTRSQEQELIQWFTEYIPTKRFDSRPRCILPSGHETSPLTSQQRTYMSKRLGQCVGALISNDAQLNENARVRVKKKRTKVPKILKQSFPSIDNEIAVVDATHAHLQDIDSFEFKNMSKIKNNKILFTASLKSSRNVQNIIWQNINAIFQKLDGKQLTADISKESTQAFCFCHVTSSAIFIYAAVVFDVCSMDVVKSVDDFGPKSAWVIKLLYTKASFR